MCTQNTLPPTPCSRYGLLRKYRGSQEQDEGRKSWASAAETKKSHALFECLSHNLLLLFERHVEKTEGLRDEVEEKKQAGRTKAKPGIVQMVRNFINSALTQATQRTQRFIRWVRVRLYQGVPWSESVASLREIWTLPA